MSALIFVCAICWAFATLMTLYAVGSRVALALESIDAKLSGLEDKAHAIRMALEHPR